MSIKNVSVKVLSIMNNEQGDRNQFESRFIVSNNYCYYFFNYDLS